MEIPLEQAPQPSAVRTELTFRDVMRSYISLGTAMPQDIGQEVFSDLLTDVAKTSRFPRQGGPAAELRASLHYEKGIVQHASQPRLAAVQFANALKFLDLPRTRLPMDRVTHETWLATTELLLARTMLSEREHRVFQKLTVHRLGQIILHSIENDELATPDREHLFGMLVEPAFEGAFLANQAVQIATPTTARQDRPRVDFTPSKVPRMPSFPRVASDFNLYEYDESELQPTVCRKVQIKSRDVLKAGDYDHDIVVLYADRDLFIDFLNVNELYTFADELASFDGIPGPHVADALSNIQLQLDLRDRHTQPWKIPK